MGLPGNGMYVVQGEMSILLTSMKRGNRWSSHSHQGDENDSLIRLFLKLKELLNQEGDLRHLDPNHFFDPFLEVIRSEETTGPVTSLALASVAKFLSYNLLDPSIKTAAACVENIADAVTHARFVGTDTASDGDVLMKILQVLRILMLSPVGSLLTNETACEIMLSCFRICFEMRLDELLRRSAEHCLKDLVQLVFTRLPEFSEDHQIRSSMKKLKMRTGAVDQNSSRASKRKTKAIGYNKHGHQKVDSISTSDPHITNLEERFVKPHTSNSDDLPNSSEIKHREKNSESENDIAPPCDERNSAGDSKPPVDVDPSTGSRAIQNVSGSVGSESSGEGQVGPDVAGIKLVSQTEVASNTHIVESSEKEIIQTSNTTENSMSSIEESGEYSSSTVEASSEVSTSVLNSTEKISPTSKSKSQEPAYVNPQGVRFTSGEDDDIEGAPLVPYGIEFICELFRFLISLCNPTDKQNSEKKLHIGLTLLTVALEVGADSIGQYQTLLTLVKDDLCRNMFCLLTTERIPLLAATLRVTFLLFESLRTHLKFQLEHYLLQLAEMVTSDSPKTSYEHKELALESIVQLWRIPGLVTELYLNYDCDLYCSNIFEDLCKLLSKNTFPVSGLFSIHLLSLDALLTVIESIERNCHSRMQSEHQESAASLSVTKSETYQDATKSIVHQPLAPPPSMGRCHVSLNIPTHEQLMADKRKKKLLATGTEHFNAKAKKGIQYLQEHHLLATPLDTSEVVHFLRENPRLDKKMIGEFISNRENLAVLDCFVKSFDFVDTRIDEALRQYLEVFRLPGESPLISLLLEHFADHWHKCNGEPFANNDAAFTLAYAVIMLNVDQHNHNAKRQNNPMTPDEFKRNLKKVNGGKDFEEDMLDEIYKSIKSCEIVMPAEQTGAVRENYLWKVLLRRGASKDGVFIHAPGGLFDHDLFSLIWGPSVAALSFIFDRSMDSTVYQKAISGFLKCALISAHYGMSNDFDNLIISLCKFTTLITSAETVDSLPVAFGANPKAQLVTRTVFGLAQRHGDILRHGWANVLECLLQLYKCKLLPKALTEAEDFLEANGKISLMREEAPSQKTETGLFSSLYSYIALSSEPASQRMVSQEDQEHIQQAKRCIRECHLELLITESKFLRIDSLQEMVKALILASHGPDGHPSLGTAQNESTAIFFLELLIKVIIQNRDRVASVWSNVRDYIYSLLMGAAACEHPFLMERCVVGLLRLAIRLMRREEMSPMILQSLRMLLLLKWVPLSRVSRNVAYGIHELLKTSAANIHNDADWSVIFTLLEVVGAGAPPPRVFGESTSQELSAQDQGAKSDGELQLGSQEDSGIGTERGYTSDSEISRSTSSLPTTSQILSQPLSPTNSPELSPSNALTGGWILVGREGEIQPVSMRSLRLTASSPSWDRELYAHDPYALIKCCESLTFLVRDVAHITPYNFEYCVHCIRTFVEASLHSTDKKQSRKVASHNKDVSGKNRKRLPSLRRRDDPSSVSAQRRARSPQNNPYDADESDSEELPSEYPIQLLDLMHTLHTRTAQIYRWWAEESGDVQQPSLWATGWCPLLQGIARLCCDSRKEVRMSAITYLQSALLMHDLQTLSAQEWESCFSKVLFPLLARLLEPVCPGDAACRTREEETRMRGATLLSKVFLHHLTPLLSLPNFTALWLTILDFLDKYMHSDHSDLLLEAIPETLKNMLLVMDSARVFSTPDGYSPLWTVTWERIERFLPSLRMEFMKAHPPEASKPPVEEIAHSPEYEVVPNEQETWLLQHQQQQMQQQQEFQQQELHQREYQQQQQQLNQSLPHSPQHEPILRNDVDLSQNAVGFTPIQVAAPNIDPNMQPHQPIPILDPAAISMAPPPMHSISNVILQPPLPMPGGAGLSLPPTIFSHMGQLVSTPITGPPAPVADVSQGSIDLSANPNSAFSSHSVSMSPEAVMEAFTPTRGSGMRGSSFTSLSHAMPNANEGGLIPASHYFFQDQSTAPLTETFHSHSMSSPVGGVGTSKGILLEGANIPTLPILSPFVSMEQPSNDVHKDEL
ncbi:Golgi-specific brefeldin A-resistance guanine nucleotide exchange factor 1 isoform X2 [Thrips palmi]|uniref:Golgi-specific brefeldin A-resistance guanine nucleotide exchange factor 1 isoform X2 n=1 Tax=Thrips palmi TaxID=161013 RepID=A0A6P8Z3X5_THRPL|nr:Golgi-specific brefeldin A-resistance guanine nucleotide exchange factor 1 isoform X2 [Thrips palmi]